MSFNKAKEYLDKKGFGDRVIVLEENTATVVLAAKALNCNGADIAKSLTFLVSGKPIMIIVPGDKKIDNHKFKEIFNEKASMIKFDEVNKYVGHEVGGVCPFGINDDVKVYLDVTLKTHEYVYPACGSDDSAVKLTVMELEELSNYISYLDVCKPRIKYTLESSLLNTDFKNAIFNENVDEVIKLKDIEIDSCIFNNIDFTNIELDNVDIIDSIFNNCNLSNKVFDKKLIERCEFNASKLTGSSFTEGVLKDCVFNDCNMCLSNFTYSKLKSVSFSKCDLSETSFIETDIKSIFLDEVILSNTEFIKTNLKDVDFSSSNIDTTIFDLYSIKGIIIDNYQSRFLVSMLGVVIK